MKKSLANLFDIMPRAIEPGPDAKFNDKLKGRVAGDNVGTVLAQLVEYYKARRQADETFHAWTKRVGSEAIQSRFDEILASIA
jgi:ferredoxin-nitrite reductase